MNTRRGNVKILATFDNAVLTYQVGDVVRSMLVSDPFFTGKVTDVDRKTRRLTVLWGNRTTSQHDLDEVMLVQGVAGSASEVDRISSRRMAGQNVEDIIATSTGEPSAQRTVFEESASVECGCLNSDGLRSRRAMYWGGPDRTYRLTKQEQESGVFVCPRCKAEMNTERFTKSDKLLTCNSCGFKIPKSKAVTNIEIKVPENVSVEVTQVDEEGQEVSGENTTALTAKTANSHFNNLDDKGRYMLLGRLQQDVKYFLKNPSVKHLWSGNVEDHIEDMKKLYNSLPQKPEWITMRDIVKYEQEMKRIMKTASRRGRFVAAVSEAELNKRLKKG